ncbi:hypothetical protein AVEN_52720-1 [Araneus ventricosus]|uniref:SOCS box domain-containing protein n=1 Tax=Araneus ventricosus TaxID=182803 RepID=A0A4Y2IIG7_ARAVE|nr:hypothetical protein AVEN_52720-1 [Araneus ventricosus]
MYVIKIKLHHGTIIYYYACPVAYSAINGDKNSLECLLRYGFEVNEYQMEKFNRQSLNPLKLRCTLALKDTVRYGYSRYGFSYQTDKGGTTTKSGYHPECCNSCNLTNKFNDDDVHIYQSSRRSIINEVIVFLMGLSTAETKEKRYKLIHCFNYLWKARSTPYVKVNEISELINTEWFNKNCPYKCWLKLRPLCDDYVAEFGKIAQGLVQPRSLKHLSRCAVRKNVTRSYFWKSGIDELEIPRELKAYLNLEF